MNERIKQLAEQAEIYAGELIDEGADYNQYPRYYTEKFAELIVQRFITEVALFGISNYENDDIVWTVEKIIQQIKEVFGKDE